MCTFTMLVQLRGTSQGISREILGSTFGKYKMSAKMTGLRASVAETDVVVVSGNGIVNGVLRGNGVDVRMVHPHPNPLPSRERGFNRRALLFSGFPRARGMTGWFAGMTGDLRLSPSPWDPLLISPWEGEGDGSRERGFNRRALLFSGFPLVRE